jgi:hypothetical protein
LTKHRDNFVFTTSLLDNLAANGKIIHGKIFGKDVGGSGSGPFGRCADNCQVLLWKSTNNSSQSFSGPDWKFGPSYVIA